MPDTWGVIGFISQRLRKMRWHHFQVSLDVLDDKAWKMRGHVEEAAILPETWYGNNWLLIIDKPDIVRRILTFRFRDEENWVVFLLRIWFLKLVSLTNEAFKTSANRSNNVIAWVKEQRDERAPNPFSVIGHSHLPFTTLEFICTWHWWTSQSHRPSNACMHIRKGPGRSLWLKRSGKESSLLMSESIAVRVP
jgi:hypothetical protein